MQTPNASTNTNVSIQISALDALMNLAGELVLGRNQLLQAIGSDDKRLLETTSQRIDMVTSEIQEQIMRTRMQPMGTFFDKIAQVVRELAPRSGKQVDISVIGEDVELDKTIMEAIEYPLTWIIRKIVEKGIESPDIRKQLKKQAQAIIQLKACNEAGQVSIEIIDDGRGIDPDAVVRKAVESGLISEELAGEAITEPDKMRFIFLPGLYTDQKELNPSNQLAGIDEIHSCLEKVGGTIDVTSRLGHGTHVRIKLPLTLSIIPSQIIKLGEARFAIPQVNLSELLRIPANQVKHTIEKIGDANVIRLRGELLPLIDLAEVLGVVRSFRHPADGLRHPERRQRVSDRRSKNHATPETDYDGRERRMDQDRRFHAKSALNIAVVLTGNYKYGLVVDDLNDSEEIVVKPLGKHVKGFNGFAGATIMGDGKVALILDVASIAEISKLNLGRQNKLSEHIRGYENSKAIENEASQPYLFFCSSEKERFAVSLDMVERIEKIEATRIETVGGHRVLKYRGGTLPLIALEDAIVVNPLPEQSHYQVICFKVNGREIGVLSTPPIDAAQVELNLDTKTLKQPGVTGSAVLMDKTTLILDIQQIVKNVKPDYFNEACSNG